MSGGLVIIGMGLACAVFRRWLAREEFEYLRRYKVELYKDVRTGEIIFLVMGVGMIGIGFLVLTLSRGG